MNDSLLIHLRDPHNADLDGMMRARPDMSAATLYNLLGMVMGNYDRLWDAYVELRGGPPPVSNR